LPGAPEICLFPSPVTTADYKETGNIDIFSKNLPAGGLLPLFSPTPLCYLLAFLSKIPVIYSELGF
jgi:hypothetical protein